MAAIDTTRHFIGANGLFGLLTSVPARLRAWNDARVTRDTLSELSNWELDDIGLCRGDIDDVAELNGRRY